ncbi:MAG: hypothetical protein HY259_11605 [Chloroflexi bacterium]|nr:hypothetical protein [Chloroflexota bacterium]
MIPYAPRFDRDKVAYFAARYMEIMSAAERLEEEIIVDDVAPRARAAGYFTKEQFLKVCYWKTPRSRPHCEKNSAEYVREVTRIALSTPNEQLRIEALTLLQGVGWPTASVFLHFGYADLYPIMDYRALWSLNIEVPPYYDFAFWWSYTECCRVLAKDWQVTMRTLDRALWQYSYENQK